jgi:Tfp pilus assembly protein PilF
MNQRAMYVVLSVLLCLDLAPKVALAEDPSDVASPPASTSDSVPIDPLVAEMNGAMSDNDLMRVLAVANQILARDPENIEALHARSHALAEAKGDYAGAVADLERVTQLAPDAADAWGNMGWWLILDGRFDEAEKALRTAHGMAPGLFAPAVNLGHTFLLRGDPASARRWYEETRVFNLAFFTHFSVPQFCAEKVARQDA